MKTKLIKINPDFPEEGLIKEAAVLLQEGRLIAFPTETVYGIAANSLNADAIKRLARIKKRPPDKPFTIHIARFEALDDLDILLSERAQKIIHKFWPGPLTIVAFNKRRERIGLRMPKNKIASALINETAVPIAASSANISGKNPLTSGEDVFSEMKGLIDIVLDGGHAKLGMESTIMDVSRQTFKILREGAISKRDLLAQYHILFVCTGNSCRSVMAKAMLEKFLGQSGFSEKIWVDSAGTGLCTGIPAALNTIEVLKEEDIDVSMHRGKAITPELVKRSDFIFVMESVHRDVVGQRFPGIDSKVKLLKEGEDVPDPIGKSLEEYRKIKDVIKDKVEDIFLDLFKRNN